MTGTAAPTLADVHLELQKLVGLELAAAARAGDMLSLHFGPLSLRHRRGRDVLMGRLALHVHCPWRVEGPDGLITGRADAWEPIEPLSGAAYQDGDWERAGNLQDRRVAEWLGIPDLPREDPRAGVADRPRTVLATRATPFEGAEIDLAGGYRLVLFPHDSRSESWRLFRMDAPEEVPHFVAGGGRFGVDRD